MRQSRIIDHPPATQIYKTPEELSRQIELIKMTIGLFFRPLNLASQMELIGALEKMGGDYKEMADYLRLFKQEKDATETVLGSNPNC